MFWVQKRNQFDHLELHLPRYSSEVSNERLYAEKEQLQQRTIIDDQRKTLSIFPSYLRAED